MGAEYYNLGLIYDHFLNDKINAIKYYEKYEESGGKIKLKDVLAWKKNLKFGSTIESKKIDNFVFINNKVNQEKFNIVPEIIEIKVDEADKSLLFALPYFENKVDILKK